MSEDQSPLNSLLATGKVITLSTGEEQKINPFRFEQFGDVIAVIKGMNFNITDGNVDIKALIFEHYDKIGAVIKIATGWSKEKMGDLQVDDALLLAITIFEVNMGFFAHRLVPMLQTLTPKLRGLK